MIVGPFVRGYLGLAVVVVTAAALVSGAVARSPGLTGAAIGGALGVADVLALIWGGTVLLDGRRRRLGWMAVLIPLKFVGLSGLVFLFVAVLGVHPVSFTVGVTAAVAALVVQSCRRRELKDA